MNAPVNREMFKDRVVAITGAGSGIGRALAIELAGHGARLALSDLDKNALLETIKALPAGVQSRAYPLDVSSRDDMFGFAQAVVTDFGTVHMIINNAGTSVVATVEHVTIGEIAKVLNVNLWGVIYGVKAFLPIMLAQKDGCIVNISSVAGLLAVPAQAAYNMSKFAVRALTETMWQELDGTGVRAVVVHPGGINTNISRNSATASAETDYERRVSAAMLGIMTTTPEDCAKQIVAGLMRGDKRLLVGAGARTFQLLARLVPDSYGALLRRKLRV